MGVTGLCRSYECDVCVGLRRTEDEAAIEIVIPALDGVWPYFNISMQTPMKDGLQFTLPCHLCLRVGERSAYFLALMRAALTLLPMLKSRSMELISLLVSSLYCD
jgi:hypothetical protein